MADVVAAAGDVVHVVPGVELTTDRGHIIALGPGDGGLAIVEELLTRVGARPGEQVDLLRLFEALSENCSTGRPFASAIVVIGAHVDMDGQLLGSPNSLSIERQLRYAGQLDALEVARDEVFAEWVRTGVKQGPHMTLLRGSDAHDPENRRDVGQWLYLPELSAAAFHHALALPEASVRYEQPDPPPTWVIEAVEFDGGMHEGHVFAFCERTNAVIGPPNSGKSLLIDALKFAFGIACDLDEVEAITKNRMAKCLPAGTIISVRLRTADGPTTITRTVGGAESPDPPFQPIVFSQTELTRRAHEPRPSIRLLDVHCPDAASMKISLSEVQGEVVDLFVRLVADAKEIRRLAGLIGNTEDGLAATRNRLQNLAGTEEVAQTATATSRVGRWRASTRERLEMWRDEAEPPSPDVPRVPDGVAGHETLAPLVPGDRLTAAIEAYEREARELIARHAELMLSSLDERSADFEAMSRDVVAKLAEAGFSEGSEVEIELKRLRDRLHEMEELDEQRRELEEALDADLVNLRNLIQRAAELRSALTRVRKEACTRVNASMRTFFALIDGEGAAGRLDEIINDLKTGTYMRPETRKMIREELDRPALLEQAVRLAQGRLTDTDDASDQERLVSQAMERERHQDLARLATTWPGDGLDLRKKGGSGADPASFNELTEGLRALAIKEISFAASELPVVTDQPEDAVPTRAVYDSLVPTLREQRAIRQFIVVSHDANLVVASDMESVTALEGADDGSPYSGSLFDRRIRDLALEHLEGGIEAFDRRATRYGRPLPA
ncbi:MAG: hypothetical protein WD354_07525 [Acidimicrobiia bacterium]